MVLEPTVFEYLDEDATSLETNLLTRLATAGQLAGYQHTGFWHCMDTLRDRRMLQQLHQLFRHSPYYSSVAETTVINARELVGRLIAGRRLGAGNRVIEIASNDGYLLQWYQLESVPVLGIEPARNIAQAAEQRGLPRLANSSIAHLRIA